MKTRLLAVAATVLSFGAFAQSQSVAPELIPIVYEGPKDPAHAPIVEQLKRLQVLESVRNYFLPYRLPRPLTLKTTGCDGEIDAWYSNDAITICYEYLRYVLETARSPDRPPWVSEHDAILGPVVDLFLHEGAHAVFEYFQVPVLGREEDAADQVATYAMLHVHRDLAPRILAGVTFAYLSESGANAFSKLRRMKVGVVDATKASDPHSLPLQRMYGVLCLAYGSDPVAYRELADKGALPKERAEGCEEEYRQVAFAFDKLLLPHIDQARLKDLFPAVGRRSK